MSEKILDYIGNLMKLSEDELNEVLLDKKYNKANLRELIRCSLSETKEYKSAFEYERSENERLQKKIETLKSKFLEEF